MNDLDNLKNDKNFKIIGVRVDEYKSENEFVKFLDEKINKEVEEKNLTKIFTINPEFLVDAFFNQKFRKILNKGMFNSPDGTGVSLGLSIISGKKQNKLTGVEITERILRYANNKNKSVYFLGGNKKKNIASKMTGMVNKRYPKIKAVGGSSEFSYLEEDDEKTINEIKSFMAKNKLDKLDFLLVGYGHIKQEFWIDRNQSKIPASISIGVGGTFDYLTGSIKRAPKLFQDLGLEWAYRLYKQPKRILRIFKAIVIFPILFITTIFFKIKL